jgi:acetylornithine deacetylase/succinyl-diaminopimelate desuccinylase-like protein
MMAAADQFDITVTGKGGHAAKPHDCIDTTVVSAHIIVALQTIASRNVDPLKQVVVSVCTVETDSDRAQRHPAGREDEGHGAHAGCRVQDFVERRLPRLSRARRWRWARRPRSTISAAIR